MNSRFDVIIVGAGFAGLYMLYRARKLGLAARVFEALRATRPRVSGATAELSDRLLAREAGLVDLASDQALGRSGDEPRRARRADQLSASPGICETSGESGCARSAV